MARTRTLIVSTARARALVISTAVAAAIVLAACGGSSDGDEPDGATPEPATSTPAALAPAGTAETELGQVLVGANGLTLYGFTDDVDGTSTCYDACAEAWPPVGPLAPAAGADPALFTTVPRDDGSEQLKVGDWPVYTFAGDAAPGDVNGQASGGVWFAITPDGRLVGVDGEAAAPVSTPDSTSGDTEAPATDGGATDIGPVLTDAAGATLYVFTNDQPDTSSCNQPCSDTWPPVPATEAVAGIDEARFGVIERADGTRQLTLDSQPLYSYIGDENPGEVNGQAVGDVWFAVGATGEVIVPAGVRIGSTDIGDVLIDADGFTLYTFANDELGVSKCNEPCSETWPPVPADAPIDAAVATAPFGPVTRDDGSEQLALGGRPLYRYVGDEFPGDANGVGIGDGVWQGVPADQVAAAQAVGAEVHVAESDLGHILVDPNGRTLYAFTNDEANASSCDGSCAEAWPPVPGEVSVAAEVSDQVEVRTIERPDGSTQLAVGNWPLYLFSGDAAPSDLNGQGSGGVWFAVAPDGSLKQ